MKKTILFLAIFFVITTIYVLKANNHSLAHLRESVSNTFTKTKNENKNNRLIEEEEYGDSNLISVNNVSIGGIKLNEITPNSVLSSFTNLRSQITEYSEMYDANVTVYTTDSGEYSFIGNKLLSIVIYDEGITVELKKLDGQILRITSGTETDELETYYNNAFASQINNQMVIYLKSSSGIVTDASITFTMVSGSVNSITLQN